MHPYTCIRCGYETKKRPDMKKHFTDRKKTCPSIKNKIELTEDIIKEILDNRVYHIPKPIINIPKQDINISRPENININEEYHYIYIVRPKENVFHNENVYKLGKTKLKNVELNISRLTSYGKGTELVFISQCNDCDILERALIEEFNKRFNKHTFGTEYYVGDKYDMIKTIGELVLKYY
jgi:hypothetical protein